MVQEIDLRNNIFQRKSIEFFHFIFECVLDFAAPSCYFRWKNDENILWNL